MEATATDQWNVLRVKLKSSSLFQGDGELEIGARSITLRDERSGSEVQLSLDCLEGWYDREMIFCSRAVPIGGHCIEFAGMGRDICFGVEFADETTAAKVSALIEVLSGKRLSPGPNNERSTSADAIETI
jgi:hypothetical protein